MRRHLISPTIFSLRASAYSASARFLHLTAVGPSWPMRGNLDTSKSKRIQPAKRRSVGNAQRKKVAAESEIQRGTTRSNSNQATVIALLSHPQGTTVSMIMKTTGWQQHSVRGFLAGDVRKRLGLTLESDKSDGERHYRIVARKSLGSGAEDADRHAA